MARSYGQLLYCCAEMYIGINFFSTLWSWKSMPHCFISILYSCWANNSTQRLIGRDVQRLKMTVEGHHVITRQVDMSSKCLLKLYLHFIISYNYEHLGDFPVIIMVHEKGSFSWLPYTCIPLTSFTPGHIWRDTGTVVVVYTSNKDLLWQVH